MAINISKFYEDETDKKIQRVEEVADKQKQNVNTAYDTQIKKIENVADRNILEAENSYDAAYADNAVNKFIAEREIKEMNAETGLQDSGLNRTQRTAVELSKNNADNLVTSKKMSFINNIRKQLQSDIASAEQSRNTEINQIDTSLLADKNNIYNEMDNLKISKTEEIINNLSSITDPTQAAAYINTASEQYGIDVKELINYSSVVDEQGYQNYLNNEKYYIEQGEYKSMHDTVSGIDTTTAAGKTMAAKNIAKFLQTHPNSTKSEIKALCKSAGIKYTAFNKYLKNNQYFTSKEEKRNMHSILADIDTTSAAGMTVAAKQIKSLANTNKLTDKEIKKLCESAGINYSDYKKFVKNGKYFTNKYTVTTGSGGGSGRRYSGSGGSGGSSEETIELIQEGIENQYERNKDVWPANERHTGMAPYICSLMEDGYSDKDIETALRQAGFTPSACMDAAYKHYYSKFDAGDWQGYFARIREESGQAAAAQELNEFKSKGWIPNNMISYAQIGAKGKIGH